MNSTIFATAIFQMERRRHVVLSLVLLIALGLSLLWPTCRTLIAEWGNFDRLTYTHGWLIALLSLGLTLHASAAQSERRIDFSWAALPVLAVTSLVWLVLLRAGIEVGHQAVLPVLLWLAAYVAFGRAMAIALAFPMAFLYFAIPIWSLINGVLQQLSVAAMRVLLPLAGVAAYFEGNTVYIASGVFEIAGGCSGLHFFIVALAIAALYGELHRDPMKLRLAGVMLVAVLAIVANWVRIFTIIVAGYLTEMQHFLVHVDHYYFGWFVFAFAMGAFFLIARRFPIDRQVGAHGPGADLQDYRAVKLAAGVFAASAALSVGPAWAFFQSIASSAAPVEDVRPGAHNANTPDQSSSWQPIFVGADLIERRQVADGTHQVETYLAEYRTQRQGKELIGYANSVIGTEAAAVARRSKVQTPDGAVAEWVLRQADGSTAVLWHFYEVGTARLTLPIAVQLWYGTRSLFGEPHARVIALRTSCASDCSAERTVLKRVLSTNARFGSKEAN